VEVDLTRRRFAAIFAPLVRRWPRRTLSRHGRYLLGPVRGWTHGL